MVEEVKPEESSTLPKQERWYMIGNAWDKGPKLRVEQNEAFQECYRTYINNKDFPQRNLMAKKQQFAQGLLNSKELKERKDQELEVLTAYPEEIPALQKKELYRIDEYKSQSDKVILEL